MFAIAFFEKFEAEQVVLALIAGIACFLVGYLLKALFDRSAVRGAAELQEKARRDAEAMTKEAKITAKEEMIKAKDEFERDTRERRQELLKLEDRISAREGTLERKVDSIDARSADLDRRDQKLRRDEELLRAENDKIGQVRAQQVKELERVAGLSREQAAEQIMNRLASELETERANMIRRAQEEDRQELERQAKEVMLTAMERYAGDCTYERTTSTIPLPNDEMKGRIIGREGRNIRAIEAATGASVLIDDTPEAVVISCFDPVRREIARLTMERLITDGRIHPTRIEEMVEKVTKEVENDILKIGQETVEKLNVTGVKQNIVRLIGRLKYRYSYSQNVLNHSIEVAYLMGAIASQIGLDERKARRAGLLHDIGKAVDHEVEGTHALIGVDLLKRNGEDDEVTRAVGCHHEEMECSTPYGTLLKVCDKLSASRPGARAETTELYIKRLEQMEAIGKAFPGVEICYAIQAGRELRVIIHPEKVNEDKALILARDIAGQVEKEMRYPGQIKVTVIRETRVTEYAK